MCCESSKAIYMQSLRKQNECFSNFTKTLLAWMCQPSEYYISLTNKLHASLLIELKSYEWRVQWHIYVYYAIYAPPVKNKFTYALF